MALGDILGGVEKVAGKTPILGGLVSAGLGYNPPNSPIIQTLPQRMASLNNKYAPGSTFGSVLDQLPPDLAHGLVRFDYNRALNGQSPLSEEQTNQVIQSYLTGKPVNPEPKGNILTNSLRDIRDIGLSIPKLPQSLYHEAQDVLAGKLGQAPEGTSGIAGVLQSPGIRLIPGAYTAANLLSGNFGEIERHPVFTLLDVLPAAEKAGLTGALGERVVQPLKESFLTKTKPGRVLDAAFGKDVRTAMGIVNTQQDLLKQDIAGNLPTDHPIAQLTRELTSLERNLSDYGVDRSRLPVINAALTDDPALRSTLSPEEMVVYDKLHQAQIGYEEYGLANDMFKRIDINGTPEVYDQVTAKKIMDARNARAQYAGLLDLRNAIDPTHPSTLDPAVLREGLSTTQNVKPSTLRAYRTALDSAGYDVRGVDISSRDAFLSTLPSVPDRPLRPVNELMQQLSTRTAGDVTLTRLRDALKRGDMGQAVKEANTISRRKVFQAPEVVDMVDELKRHRDINNVLGRFDQYTEKGLQRLTDREAKTIAGSPPPRLVPLIEKEVQGKIREAYSTDPNFPALAQFIADKNYDALPGIVNVDEVTRDVARTWQTLRDNLPENEQPVFIHRVSPSKLGQIENPSVISRITEPSQVKARTLNAAPTITDPIVALTHQGVELLDREHKIAATNAIKAKFGRSLFGEDGIANEYMAEAQRLAGLDPLTDTRGHLERLIKRDWVKYDPQSLFGYTAPKLKVGVPDEATYIPKKIADALESLGAKTPGAGVSRVLDPYMQVFRTSLLTLRPQWYVNNIFGGLALLLGRTDPRVLGYFNTAREALRTGELPTELGLGSGAVSVPQDIIANSWLKGSKMRDFLEQHPVLDEASGRFQSFTERMFKFNQLADDQYRAMAYLYGHDTNYAKFIKAGDLPDIAEARAKEAGIALTKKIMPDWTTLTPFERQVMRNLFPFYGWMRHIMQYTLSYPIDHPVRAAMAEAFTRTELEDNHNLPDRFLGSFFLGTDNQGMATLVNPGAANPFGDVANMFTLAGFVRNVNPVIATALRAIGVDPSTGTADAFPEQGYDPYTGRVRPTTGGILSNLAFSALPQARAVSDLFTRNNDFKNLLRTDPEGAYRQLRSELGLPTFMQQIDYPTQVFRAELARKTAKDAALANALKLGLDAPGDYPQLQAVLDKLRKMPPEELKKYIPANANPPSLAALGKSTFLALNR